MSRLITGGCSFTQYCWPTWADYLGSHYDTFVQTGLSGIDNATIARRIMNVAQQGDHVVILWTGFDRWSNFKDQWIHKGSIVADREFFIKYYSPVERFTVSMDYIKMIDMHSKLFGYRVWHFSAFPWFLGEIHQECTQDLIKIYNNYSIENFYIEQNLEEFNNINGKIYINHKYNQNDDHPTPARHKEWLEQVVAPIMKIDLNDLILKQAQIDHEQVIAGNII